MARDKKIKGDWWKSAAGIRNKYEESSRTLRSAQWEYEENQAMLQRQQWLQRHAVTNTLVEIPREGGRTRITADRLLPASRHLMARLLSRPLVFEVPARATDDATIRGARTAQSVLMDLIREKNWESIREQAAWAAWVGGTSAISLDWDASAGTPLGTLPISGKPFGTGDISLSALTIQEVTWEPGTRDAERSNWWIRAQALPPAEVKDMFKMKEEPQADSRAALTPVGRRAWRAGSDENAPNLTLVLTMYHRPTHEVPQGSVATVIGNQIVGESKPWPFPFKDRLNLVVLRETIVPGQAHGYTTVSTAVPLQCALNASLSALVEHMKHTGNARMVWPDTFSDEEVEDLSDLPGEILTGNTAAGLPAWISPPQMPQWVIEQPAMLAAQMDDILGLHDVSRGQAPKNLESGLGLSILVEQDTTPLGSLTREMARGFERLGTLVLKTYEAKVKEPREARIQIPGRVPEVVSWTGKALAGQTQAVVPLDAVMPNSKAASFAMAKELWDRFPTLQERPEEFARLAQLPEPERLIEALDADTARAERENQLMALGKVAIPADFDDHAKHLKVVNRFRKSARYETMDEQQRKLFDDHAQAHEVMAAEEAGKQAAKAALLGGNMAGQPTANEAPPLPSLSDPNSPFAQGPAGALAQGAPASGAPQPFPAAEEAPPEVPQF